MAVIGVALAAGVFQLNTGVSDIAQSQQDGVVRGYLNRAVTCDLQKALGAKESQPGCSDPAIQEYRDKAVVTGSSAGALNSQKTMELVCVILQQSAKRPGSAIVIPPAYCPNG